jgi:Cu/Ag efflux protein CusF
MDGVTVNGITPGGMHETLIQAPLNVTFQETQQTLTPATFIPGQLVDVQAAKVDLEASGFYTLSNGSMTFEFTVPASTNAQASSNMTLVESLTKRRGFISEEDTGQFATYLYNWNMGTWDAIPLSIFTYTTSDTEDYIGPGGRVLLQCANLDPSQGPLLFNRPSLSLANS